MQSESDSVTVMAWDPIRALRSVDPGIARYSRGFLRSKPEKWFPGIAAQWLPLAHSLGVELRPGEVKPSLELPDGLDAGFGFEIDGEHSAILLDRLSVKVIQDAITPSALTVPKELVLEYLARRLLGSLALAWSGSEASQVLFDSRIDPSNVQGAGAVKIGFSMNNQAGAIWLLLGPKMVERLDGLWKRQMQSASRQGEGASDVHIEIAQLAVPPSMLVDYMRSGTVIDLEIPTTDTVTIRVGAKAMFSAKVCNVGGNLGLETLPGPAQTAALPDGTTRLSIDFGKVSLDAASLSELSQPNAVWDSGLRLKDTVDMVINGEKVGEATLCTYEGRFAISVS